MRLFQAILLRLYGWTVSTGVLKTGWGRRAFYGAYVAYKAYFEARHSDQLRALVSPDTVVIDVGANVGFFTLRFARWVAGAGKVVAIEPEPANVQQLRGALARAHLEAKVEVVEAAATAEPGYAQLVLDPAHPANYHLGAGGMTVRTVSLDVLLDAMGRPRVCLIKIDVQGAEMLVLRGAEHTLARCWPALYVEVFDEGLRALGSSAAELLGFLTERGYQAYRLTAHGPLAVADFPSGEYGDLLFLQEGS